MLQAENANTSKRLAIDVTAQGSTGVAKALLMHGNGCRDAAAIEAAWPVPKKDG